MKYILTFIFVLAVWFFPQTSIFAQSNTSIKKIYFVEEANWPPFTPNNYGQTKEGLSYILMQAIFSRLDIEVDLELYPQKRMLLMLKNTRKDAATIISKSEERLKFLDYSDPILQKKGYIYYLKDNNPNFSWEEYKDLQGLSIGVVAGHNLGNEFEEAIKKYNLQIQRVSQSKKNFDMLLNRRVDIILSIEPTANYFLKDPMYGNKISHASKQYYSKYYYIGFSKKSKAKNILPKVNNIIREMKKDGSLQKILSQYSLSF